MEKNFINYANVVFAKTFEGLVNRLVNYVSNNGGCIRMDNPGGWYTNVFCSFEDGNGITKRKVLGLRVNDGELEVCLAPNANPEAIWDENNEAWYPAIDMGMNHLNLVADIANTILENSFIPSRMIGEKERATELIYALNDELGLDIDFDVIEKVDSAENVSMWQGTVKSDWNTDENEVYVYVIDSDDYIAKQVYAEGAYPMTLAEARTYRFDDGCSINMLGELYQPIKLYDYEEGEDEIIFDRLVALKQKYGTGVRVNCISESQEWVEWEDYKGNKYVSTFLNAEVEDRETVMI